MNRALLTFFSILPILIILSIEDIKTKKIHIYNALLILLVLPATEMKTAERIIAMLLPLTLVNLYGTGDIFVMSVLGFVLGPKKIISIYVSSAISAGIYALAGLAAKKINTKETFAFMPCLLLGFIASFFKEIRAVFF